MDIPEGMVEEARILDHPKVVEAIANIQSVKDTEIRTLTGKVADLEGLKDELLAAASRAPAPESADQPNPLKAVVDNFTRKGQEATRNNEQQELTRLKAAAELSSKPEFKSYVSFQELSSLRSEREMYELIGRKMADVPKQQEADKAATRPSTPATPNVTSGIRRYTPDQIRGMDAREVQKLNLTPAELALIVQKP